MGKEDHHGDAEGRQRLQISLLLSLFEGMASVALFNGTAREVGWLAWRWGAAGARERSVAANTVKTSANLHRPGKRFRSLTTRRSSGHPRVSQALQVKEERT